jgi:hypothetical protein
VYTPSPYTKRPDRDTLAACKALLAEASAAWNVPPAHITSHIRANGAQDARRWLMGQMLELGLKRNQVAWAFGLDLRRVRRSEIGGRCTPHGKPGGDKYRKVDLLGYPLPVAAVVVKPKRPRYRERFMEALEVLRMVSQESEVARRWVNRWES